MRRDDQSGDGKYDVVIVGARVAGAATAMLLAREGARVLVVDRAPRGADTLSTHALMRAGVLQMTRWGLLDEIVAAGTPAVRRSTFHFDDTTTVVSIKPAAGVDALYAPRRTLIDRVLVDAARAAGAEFRFRTTVTALTHDGHGRVSGIAGYDETRRSFQAMAPLTIGADGINSFVARAVDAPFEQVGKSASAFVYGYWSGLDADGYEWFYRPGVSAGMIPTNDGEVCVFGGAPLDVARRTTYDALLARAAPDARDRLAAGRRPARLRRFAGVAGYVRRAWGPGWALVGDAGYFKDPLSTHGMTDAFRDAELLACAIAGGDLAAYQRERDRLSRRLFAVVDALAGYEWDTEEVRRLLLQLSSSMSEEVEALLALDRSRRPASTMTPS
jgi:flavin-dependent dehydrogenase